VKYDVENFKKTNKRIIAIAEEMKRTRYGSDTGRYTHAIVKINGSTATVRGGRGYGHHDIQFPTAYLNDPNWKEKWKKDRDEILEKMKACVIDHSKLQDAYPKGYAIQDVDSIAYVVQGKTYWRYDGQPVPEEHRELLEDQWGMKPVKEWK
jgi:hypothetical protein